MTPILPDTARPGTCTLVAERSTFDGVHLRAWVFEWQPSDLDEWGRTVYGAAITADLDPKPRACTPGRHRTAAAALAGLGVGWPRDIEEDTR